MKLYNVHYPFDTFTIHKHHQSNLLARILYITRQCLINYNRLYHQITVKIEEYVKLPQVQSNEELVQFYSKFIKDFETKLNPLSLVNICVTISKTFKGTLHSTTLPLTLVCYNLFTTSLSTPNHGPDHSPSSSRASATHLTCTPYSLHPAPRIINIHSKCR